MANIIKMVKPKKWVALLGYSGHGYFGMQRQTCDNKEIDALPTIESELLKSFHQAGLINENESNNPGLLRFQRAARTDKGVSAVKQVISLNLPDNAKEYLPKVNELLPPQIRIFSAKRVTKNFCSKNFCDARTYSYLLPSFAICPVDQITTENFTISKEVIEEFNSVLKMYIGTHNFHNFTSGKKPTDPSARRFIISFECSEPFVMGNDEKKIEFLVARVKGQSFMLHQIRKMVGLAIAVMRGFVNRSGITRAFGTERLDVPIAPGLGLLLEEVHYERYNKKYGGDGVHETLKWDELNAEITSFKKEFIYPKIITTELEARSMFDWLSTLPIHTFGVRTSPQENSSELEKPLVKAYYNANQPSLKVAENESPNHENTVKRKDMLTNEKDTKEEEYENDSKKIKV